MISDERKYLKIFVNFKNQSSEEHKKQLFKENERNLLLLSEIVA